MSPVPQQPDLLALGDALADAAHALAIRAVNREVPTEAEGDTAYKLVWWWRDQRRETALLPQPPDAESGEHSDDSDGTT